MPNDSNVLNATAGADASLRLAPGLTREFLEHHRLCPKLCRADGTVVIALAPEAISEALDDISLAYRAAVEAEVASAAEVDALIERLVARSHSNLENIELARVADRASPGD